MVQLCVRAARGPMCAAWIAGLGGAAVAAATQPDPSRVFDMARGRPTSIVVTRSVEPPGDVGELSPMLRALAGVLDVMQPRDLVRLRTMVRGGEAPGSLEESSLVAVVHLVAPSASKRVEILTLPDGSMVASEVDPVDESGQGAAVVLTEEFSEVTAGWARYQGGFDGAIDDATPRGRSIDLAHPYTPGWITFDVETLGDRFLNGGDTNLRAAARDLEAETLWVRLPAGYDPRTPPGLIVWIDPTDSGQPPEFMHDAADEFNLVIVGAAAAGNDRYISDRHQLMFDAMATAMARYHVEPSRVYAAGVSGGGRVACMYWACFAEVFAGAVAIVGSSSYENVPMGNGNYMPRGFTLPTGARSDLRGHRLAAITGPRDVNAWEIRQTLNIFDHDGFDVELFEYADMGHEYPTAGRFKEALEWADEPWRAAREEAEARAASMLEGFKRRHAGGALSPGDREALVRITQEAPWSAPAWEAAVLLGYASRVDEAAEATDAGQE